MTSAIIKFDVLVEGTAVKDIGELGSSTDGENRHLESSSFTKQGQLPFVAVWLDGPKVFICVMSVAIGLDVRSPAQDQSVETSEDARDVGVAGQLNGKSTGGGHRRRIVREVQVEFEFVHRLRNVVREGRGRPSASRHANKRFAHSPILRSGW